MSHTTRLPPADAPNYERSATLAADLGGLEAALDGARERDATDTPALRGAVTRLSVNARAGRLAPERLLVILKDAVAAPRFVGVATWWRASVTEQLVRWGIEGYYGAGVR